MVITGPESTGKTWLVERLAKAFNGIHVFEYAREYVESLNRPYTYDDLIHIAEKQVEHLNEAINTTQNQIIFVDTFLEITRVWFEWKYKQYPEWITGVLKKSAIDLFLLCNTDIPWVADEVRENGGENRELLFQQYKRDLEHFNLPYKVIAGQGQKRVKIAFEAVKSLIYL